MKKIFVVKLILAAMLTIGSAVACIVDAPIWVFTTMFFTGCLVCFSAAEDIDSDCEEIIIEYFED